METNGKRSNFFIGIIITVFVAVIGWILLSQTKLDTKVEAYRTERDDKLEKYQAQILDYNEKIDGLRQDVGSIKTDVEWLKRNI